MNGIILMSIIATAITLGGTGGYRLAVGYRLDIGELAAAAAASLGVGIILAGLSLEPSTEAPNARTTKSG